MRRRTLFLGAAAATGFGLLPGIAKVIRGDDRLAPGGASLTASRDIPWTGADFASGGTKAIDPDALPAPIFRSRPQCVATPANILGPCDADGVPVRLDISEGRPGLPLRMSIRVVDAATCQPQVGAEIQVWHTNARGIYSGAKVTKFCTLGDREAMSGLAFRGRQVTGSDGVASFLTVYPGWYGGRSVHVHIRVIVRGRELLVTQLFFDDLLSDAIYGGHPDYAGRPQRDTRNDQDDLVPRARPDAFTFDFEKLDGGILQASYTMGVAA